MDGWNGWLTATPADKNEGRKGGKRRGDWIGLGGIRLDERVFKIISGLIEKV